MNKHGYVFKALSDMTRLRVMRLLLSADRELCICELVDALALAQYNVSRHVKELKTAGLVRERKEGRFVLYALVSPQSEYHRLILKAVAAMDEETAASDGKRLRKRLSLREKGKCVVGMQKCGC